MKKNTSNNFSSDRIKTLALAALFAALCYIGFQVFRFDIPVGTEKTAIHFGNAFVVIAALLLGGVWGGLAGAIGLTLADLTSGYVTSAPATFVLKFGIGLITGLIAHQIFHITQEYKKSRLTLSVIAASSGGMLFNLVADPIIRYLYKLYILGIPQDAATVLAKIGALTTLVNAVTSVLIASVLYLALRPVLIKAGLFPNREKKLTENSEMRQTHE